MKCEIIRDKTHYGLEQKVNEFIKHKDVSNVSVSSNSHEAGVCTRYEYIACILYKG